jgi:hypothetical protein
MGKVGKCPYNYLLSFDEMGQISRFTLPDSIRDYPAVGEGLFVRNDSLILRTHGSYFTSVSHVKWLREQGYEDDEIGMFDYYWDRKALQWVAIPFADDQIISTKIKNIRCPFGHVVNGVHTYGSCRRRRIRITSIGVNTLSRTSRKTG